MLIPRHIAFIMDGNGRWGEAHGLSRSAGHKAGLERIEHVLLLCRDLGVEIVSVFAWSSENWSRPKKEVDYIMRLLENRLPRAVDRLREEKIRFFHSGDRAQLTSKALKVLKRATEITQDNSSLVFNFAFNYGGRDDILNAVRKIVSAQIPAGSITEDIFARNLWSHPLPDIDLLVRCGAEKRLSNFMLWQSAYSEIYLTDVYWPDMGRLEIHKAIRQFGRSKREIAEPAVSPDATGR
ncbi:polyprenyl diphosphate synthase [Candidatus Hydrogenedentota bacterium]